MNTSSLAVLLSSSFGDVDSVDWGCKFSFGTDSVTIGFSELKSTSVGGTISSSVLLPAFFDMLLLLLLLLITAVVFSISDDSSGAWGCNSIVLAWNCSIVERICFAIDCLDFSLNLCFDANSWFIKIYEKKYIHL